MHVTPHHATPQAEGDAAIREARAAAHRSAPYWPFGQLTPMQQRQRAAQERAMRHAQMAKLPGALL